MIGWKVIPRIGIGPVQFSPHGVGIAFGCFVGAWLMARRARARGFDENHAWNTAAWGVVGAIIGARLAYVIGQIRQNAEAAGRDPDALRTVVRVNPVVTAEAAPSDAVPHRGTVVQVSDYLLAAHAAGADEILIDLQQTILRVQEESEENFMRQMRQAQAQKLSHARRRIQQSDTAEFLAQGTAGQFNHRLQLRVFARPETGQLFDLRLVRAQKPVQAAEALQRYARQIDNVVLARTRSQEHRQQLGLGQCLRAAREQPLARPFACGPVPYCHRDAVTRRLVL